MTAVPLAVPLPGRSLVQNSPARRVPSHGVDVLGQRYAIDLVPVDDEGRSAPRTWRSWLTTEPAEIFVGFGRPVLAPVDGVVVRVHDGEPDHVARRAQSALLAYAVGQAGRLREGVAAVAGNHVVLRDRATGAYVALVHLQAGSTAVLEGGDVRVGQRIGACGNSGNSTEPHVHLQAMDHHDLAVARGLPVELLDYRQQGPGRGTVDVARGVPAEGSVIRPRAADGVV